VEVLDDPEDYDGTALSIAAGPATEYTTAEVASGSHTVAVAALDAAGNAANALTGAASVLALPAAASGATWGWASYAATLSGTAAAGLDGITIYSNYQPATDELLDAVITDAGAAATYNPTTGAWSRSIQLTSSTAGVLRVMACPVSAAGIERPDGSEYSISVPPTPLDLGVVIGPVGELAAVAGADGDISVSCAYRYQDGDALHSVLVWVKSELTATSALGTPTITILATAGVGYPLALFSAECGLSLSTGDTRYVYAVAQTALGARGTYSGPVTVVADATAPTHTGTVTGAAQ
jgi:hypothetical protein